MLDVSPAAAAHAEDNQFRKFHGQMAVREKSQAVRPKITGEWLEAAKSFVGGKLDEPNHVLNLMRVGLKTAASVQAVTNGCGEMVTVDALFPRSVLALSTVTQAFLAEAPHGTTEAGFFNQSQELTESIATAMFSETGPRKGLIPPGDVRSAFSNLCCDLTTIAEKEHNVPPTDLGKRVRAKLAELYPAVR